MSTPPPDAATSAAPLGGYDDAYVAHLWEHPHLCLALFGVQFLTPEGQRSYEGSGINEEMFPALGAAQAAGLLLLNRVLTTEEGPVLMQYWCSYEDLDRWARQLPHMRWWRWLLENAGPDLSFYHEIYQVAAAEAIYERGADPSALPSSRRLRPWRLERVGRRTGRRGSRRWPRPQRERKRGSFSVQLSDGRAAGARTRPG